jgi:hypothetical protein
MATKAQASAQVDTLVVLDSFVGNVGGADRLFRRGDLIRPDDPAVAKWPTKFGPARFMHDRVEQATAAPGEVR